MSHGVLGGIRGRLLGGAAGIALPAAVLAVSFGLGVGLPTEAQAQSSSFNGTQATTYTLTTGANTQTFTFGPNAVIGPTAPLTPGVTGDTLTGWNVINEGQINGGGGGFTSQGIYLNTAGGNNVTNSGTITQGIDLHAGGNITNLAAGTISGGGGLNIILATNVTNAGLINTNIQFVGQDTSLSESLTNQSSGTITGRVIATGAQFIPATVTNAGAIGGGVYLGTQGGGTVINQSGATIANGTTAVLGAVIVGSYDFASANRGGGGTVTNAGTVTGTGTSIIGGYKGTDGVVITTGNFINLNGGIVTSAAASGIFIIGSGAGSVTNQAGGTITGATNGVSVAPTGGTMTVINAGAMTGTAANGMYFRNTGSSVNVTNQAGGTITGGVNGILFLPQIVLGFGGNPVATITNAGTISGTSGAGISLGTSGNGIATASITNLRGATISGTTGIYIYNGAPVTITNAGTITGTGGTAIDIPGRAYSTLILQTGSVLNGTAIGTGSTGFEARLVLQGTGIANNNFEQFSTLEVDASGVWALNGVFTSAIAQSAVINSGTLVIGDGSHPGAQFPGLVTIYAGTTLGGQGTVGNILGGIRAAPGGTVAPGVVSPFSTLNDASNVQFDVTSFFNVIVNAAGQNDALAASGTATLTGGIVQVLAQPGDYAATTNYTILTAGTRNSTTFAGVTSSSIFVTPTLTYPTQQEVVLTLAGHPFSYVAATPNQLAVANALGAGPFGGLADAVFNQPTAAGAQHAFDAISGEIFGSVQNALADETQLVRNAILDRLRQASYADGGDLAALAYGGSTLAFDEPSDNPLAAVASPAHAEVQGGGQAEPYVKAPASRGMTYWAQALGGFGHVDGDGNAAALSSSFAGLLTGFDARFGAMRAGVMAGYTQSNLDVDARASSAGIESGSFGAYAGAAFGAFKLRAGGSATFASIDTSRMIAFPGFSDTTHARFDGGTGQAFGEIGYGMAFGRVAVEPFAGLAYARVNTGSFLESGGIAALSGSSDAENIGYSSLGLRAASIWMLPGGTALIPRGSVQWQHAFGDVVPTAALAFAGTGAAFSINGVPIAKDAALVEAGLDWRITANLKLGIEYQGELAMTAQTHTGKGTVTWDF